MNTKLLSWITEREDLVVPTLFKPIQFEVLKKINQGKKLDNNEKRYLRGKIKDKLNVINTIILQETENKELNILLNTLDSYYITGLEALKHNGYGWYFDPKIIEILNTKIEGRITLGNQNLKFIRVKSIKKIDMHKDEDSGLKYATNEQIIKDTQITKNEYTKTVWTQMHNRYGKVFADTKINGKREEIDYSIYGV